MSRPLIFEEQEVRDVEEIRWSYQNSRRSDLVEPIRFDGAGIAGWGL